MRRYVISHFREPMDIASSALGEKHAVYGGGPNLKLGLRNTTAKYHPSLVGVATTCLTETIGDDVSMILSEFKREFSDILESYGNPELVFVSTPSYAGSHIEGFQNATKAMVDQLAVFQTPHERVAVFPGFLSPADIRYLKEVFRDFNLPATVLPDISLTMDGPVLEEYEKVPRGGTPIHEIKSLGGSKACIEFGRVIPKRAGAGRVLKEKFGTPLFSVGTPMGLRETDAFFAALEELAGRAMPETHALERGRLIDSYVDGHKYLSGKRAVVYGDPDLVVGLTSFLAEIGVHPVLCAAGSPSGKDFESAVREVTHGFHSDTPAVRDDADFYEIAEEAEALDPDFLVGNGKGYHLARRMNRPLIRVGFPIHDRFGGQRILHIGYRGAQNLLDRIVNSLLEAKQESSPVGYTYL
jgi:nitrogenase molybdenum-iron protein NifN